MAVQRGSGRGSVAAQRGSRGVAVWQWGAWRGGAFLFFLVCFLFMFVFISVFFFAYYVFLSVGLYSEFLFVCFCSFYFFRFYFCVYFLRVVFGLSSLGLPVLFGVCIFIFS